MTASLDVQHLCRCNIALCPSYLYLERELSVIFFYYHIHIIIIFIFFFFLYIYFTEKINYCNTKVLTEAT